MSLSRVAPCSRETPGAGAARPAARERPDAGIPSRIHVLRRSGL